MKKKVITYILLILFPPAGIILLIKDNETEWGKKMALIVSSGLWMLLLLLTFITPHLADIDANGWKHYKDDTSLEEIIASSSDNNTNSVNQKSYAVITADKSLLAEMNAHDFIETIRKNLITAKIYEWTLFRFEDGTGIMFPGSDISEPALYGVVNEKDTIDIIYGVININGTTVSYQNDESYVTDPGYEYCKYIPAEYVNESTYTYLNEGILEIHVQTNEDGLTVVSNIYAAVSDTLTEDITEIHFYINGDKIVQEVR